jgi:hypothetical protein
MKPNPIRIAAPRPDCRDHMRLRPRSRWKAMNGSRAYGLPLMAITGTVAKQQ